jgi:hypothetical protein
MTEAGNAQNGPFMRYSRPQVDLDPNDTDRRLSEGVPVYAAPDQDVCGVDMSLNNVQAVVT